MLVSRVTARPRNSRPEFPALEQPAHLLDRKTQPNVKRTEQGVIGAGLIETHFIDQLLEDQRIVREEIHAPLPVVKSDRAGDDLFDLACIPPADEAMIA